MPNDRTRPWTNNNMDLFQIAGEQANWMPNIGIERIEWRAHRPWVTCAFCGQQTDVGLPCSQCGGSTGEKDGFIQLGAADITFFSRLLDGMLTLFRMEPGDVCEILYLEFGMRPVYEAHDGGLRLHLKGVTKRWMDNILTLTADDVARLVLKQTVACEVELLLPKWTEEIALDAQEDQENSTQEAAPAT